MADKMLAEKKALEKKPVEPSVAKIPEKKDTEEVKAIQPIEQVEEQQEVASAVQPEESIAQIESDDSDDGSDDDDEDDIDLDNITFVGRYDMETREIKESIQKEIAKYWKPPVGIAKTTKCEFLVLVGPDGKVVKVEVRKKSGSLAYDISGRAAIYQSHFKKELCGKEFIIELGAS